jgi:hypothetical protein
MGVIAAGAVLLAILAWFFWPSRTGTAPKSAPSQRADIDAAELEAAERDVQEAPDQDSVRDWGPGTGQKPLP